MDSAIQHFTEKIPEFPGGNDSLVAFFKKNISYPAKAYFNDIEGTVLIKYIIEADGSIANPRIIVPLSPSCDSAAMRAVKAMPKWKVAKNPENKQTRIYYLPITFQLVRDTALDNSDFNDILGVMIYAKDSVNDHKYDNVPSFPGGPSALKKYLQTETQWPANLLQADIIGVVLIQAFVETDGSLTKIKVVNSLHPDMDKEALRVVKSMPKWIPAVDLQGKPIRSLVDIPVRFSRN